MERPDVFDELELDHRWEPAAIPAGGLLRQFGAYLLAMFGEWLADRLDAWEDGRQRRRQRRDLHKMPDHMLKDIGLSRGDLYHGFGRRK
jgi:uncharacterized protein YjiS (DUF1127 family)